MERHDLRWRQKEKGLGDDYNVKKFIIENPVSSAFLKREKGRLPYSVFKPTVDNVKFMKSLYKGRPPTAFFSYPSYVGQTHPQETSENIKEYNRRGEIEYLFMSFLNSDRTHIYNAVVNTMKNGGFEQLERGSWCWLRPSALRVARAPPVDPATSGHPRAAPRASWSPAGRLRHAGGGGGRCWQARRAVLRPRSTFQTFAGTAKQASQRLLSSEAACNPDWVYIAVDVEKAFLQVMTNEEIQHEVGEILREVNFTLPPGYAAILR